MSERSRAGGVLPINAAATRKQQSNQAQAKAAQRAPAPRLRLMIRRLPPGLTEGEFWTALGDEWLLGKGKIDWAAYKDGKVSKDPSKPSRPARVYLKVKDQSLLDSLSMRVKQAVFQDARNTSKDSCLLGPPSLEFAPYSKMPSNRIRHDGRQGTIDQDQEFIDFLQSLTEPITKPSANGVDADAASEKVTTTPLVQYLKEKKANKAKEAAEKKSKAKQDAKDVKPSKTDSNTESKSTVIVKGPTSATEKARVAKATQEAVKAINKSVASMQTKPAAAKADAKASAKEATPPPPSPAKRERERGNASAAARMLQRDLGLTPKAPRASRVAPTSPAASKAEPASAEKNPPPPTQPKASTPAPTAATPPTGPRNARPSTAPTTQAASPSTAPSYTATAAPKPTPPPVRKLPHPSPNAKSAFLKHANPSQGVTEDLLRTTFSTFGNVLRCEIDKKKGLGYVDFEDTEGLRKAMAASPVMVGEGGGKVVVMENRNLGRRAVSKTTTNTTAVTTGPDSAAASPVATAATPAASVTTAPTAPAALATPPTQQGQTSAPSSPATAAATPVSPTAAAPTAPRASTRGGTRGGRGAPAAPRGNFGPSPRGAPRGAFRGPRGNFGRGGRGGAAGPVARASTGSESTAPANGNGIAETATGGGNGGEK